MKLYETILTYADSTEVYKRYDYFKTLKECKNYMNTYGMELVRCKEVETYSSEIIEKAKQDYIERMKQDLELSL